jgi:hypothetical protein
MTSCNGLKDGVWRSRENLITPFLDALKRSCLVLTLMELQVVDIFLEAPITQKNQRRYSLVRRGRSAAQSRTVRELVQELGFPA